MVSVKKRSSSGPRVQIHFTSLLYANGYSIPLDAKNLQAEVMVPDRDAPEAGGQAVDGDAPLYAANLAASPAQAQPPPLHNPGPNIGVIAGVTLGASVGILAVAVLLHHREGSYSSVLFDTGWQFEMVLQSPLTVDASSIPPAASPAAQ